MAVVSTEKYHKLFQKTALLETKMHRLKVFVEVNCVQLGNET